jgi:hypothetical protein
LLQKQQAWQPFQQNWPNQGFPTNGAWPNYDTQYGPTNNSRRLAGKLAPGNRSQ